MDVEEVWRADYKLYADQPMPCSRANWSFFFFFQITLNRIFSKFKFWLKFLIAQAVCLNAQECLGATYWEDGG